MPSSYAAIRCPLHKFISDLVDAQVASGNFAQDAGYFSPARSPQAITVSATDITDRDSVFSNYGIVVDILAPGVDIIGPFNVDPYVSLMPVII